VVISTNEAGFGPVYAVDISSAGFVVSVRTQRS